MAAILIATTSGLLLASTPKKKSRPSMKARTAKSSALINKTLELHTGNTDRLSRSDILFIMLLHTQTHTHTHTHTHLCASFSILPSPLLVRELRSEVRAAYMRSPPSVCLCLSVLFYPVVTATSSW